MGKGRIKDLKEDCKKKQTKNIRKIHSIKNSCKYMPLVSKTTKFSKWM